MGKSKLITRSTVGMSSPRDPTSVHNSTGTAPPLNRCSAAVRRACCWRLWSTAQGMSSSSSTRPSRWQPCVVMGDGGGGGASVGECGSMCVCTDMCVCMCVCRDMCVCMRECACLCACACLCVYGSMCGSIHTCECMRTQGMHVVNKSSQHRANTHTPYPACASKDDCAAHAELLQPCQHMIQVGLLDLGWYKHILLPKP